MKENLVLDTSQDPKLLKISPQNKHIAVRIRWATTLKLLKKLGKWEQAKKEYRLTSNHQCLRSFPKSTQKEAFNKLK